MEQVRLITAYLTEQVSMRCSVAILGLYPATRIGAPVLMALVQVKASHSARLAFTTLSANVALQEGQEETMALRQESPAKRSQAALEFFMTYGWAIVVALGALCTFGVKESEGG